MLRDQPRVTTTQILRAFGNSGPLNVALLFAILSRTSSRRLRDNYRVKISSPFPRRFIIPMIPIDARNDIDPDPRGNNRIRAFDA